MAALCHSPTVRLCDRLCFADRRSVDVDPTSPIECVSAPLVIVLVRGLLRPLQHIAARMTEHSVRLCRELVSFSYIVAVAHRGCPSFACALDFGTVAATEYFGVALWRARS